ncbi:MAG: sugar fermentation stimulation protein SfsA, partial [Aquificaceae bacterium]
MRFPKLIVAEFLSRLNRFVCLVKIKRRVFYAYVRNTGRLTELLCKGKRVYLRKKESGKYLYEVLLVLHEGTF